MLPPMPRRPLDDLIDAIDRVYPDLLDAVPEAVEGVTAHEIGFGRIDEDPEDEIEGSLQALVVDHVLFTAPAEGRRPPVRDAAERLIATGHPDAEIARAIAAAPWDLVRFDVQGPALVLKSLTGGPVVPVHYPAPGEVEKGDEALVRIIRARGCSVALILSALPDANEALPPDIRDELRWTARERDEALRPLRLFLATITRGLAGLDADADETAITDALDAEMEGILGPQTVATPTVSRNANCPCGSGKKYKKCCGA
jgi:hypothetical protein